MTWNLAPPAPEEMAAIVAALEACWPKPRAAVAEPVDPTPAWRWSGRWWGPAHAEGGAAARRRP